MLDTFRKTASTTFARVLFGLLALAFAVWGIEGRVNLGGNAGTLARVGSTSISGSEFARAFEDQLNMLRARTGGRITAEQARMFGLDQQVLGNLIGITAIDNEASRLDLALSDKVVADMVSKDPSFLGPDGRFDKAGLDQYLRQRGMTEAGFLKDRAKDELRGQLLTAIASDTRPPKFLIDLFNGYRAETRTIQSLTIDPATAVTVPEPDEAKLKAAYEAKKAQYLTPELRKLGLLMLTMDDVKKRNPVKDEEVKAAYDQEKERYEVLEKRKVQQLSFKDKATADDTLKKIKAGTSFADAGKAFGLKPADIELGVLTKKDLIDPTIANVAFSLPKDQVSDVVPGRFSFVILKVTEIDAGRQKPFDEVKKEIADRLGLERAAPILQKLRDDLDDARAAGKTLKQAGEFLKIPYLEVETDKEGNDASGKPVMTMADKAFILAAAFQARKGVESEPVELSDGGFTFIGVDGITPGQQKPFDAVKDQVKTAVIGEERQRLVIELADKLAERANKGEALEALAGDAHGTVKVSKPLKRGEKDPALADPAIQQAFVLAKGAAAAVPGPEGKSRAVIRVLDIAQPPDPTKAEATELMGALRQQLRQETFQSYVGALQEKQGVSVDAAAVQRAIGATGSQ